jgi:hypothetical protein
VQLRLSEETDMSWTRIGMSFTGAAAVLSILLASSTVWLLLTSPVTVAGALKQGTVTPIVRQLVIAFVDVLRGLLAYL